MSPTAGGDLTFDRKKQALAEHSRVYSESQRLPRALGGGEAAADGWRPLPSVGVCFVSVIAFVSRWPGVGGETYNASVMLLVTKCRGADV